MSESPVQKQSPSQSESNSRQRLLFVVIALGVVVVVVTIIVVYALARQDDDASPAGVAASTPVTPVATRVPPTEPPTEVALQQQLHDWLVTVRGVDTVQSLDVDTPGDEPPLIYAEITVAPGYNNSGIPAEFAARVGEALRTTQYSDFVMIIDDGVRVVEYTLDSETSTWDETVLSTEPPAAAQSN